MKLRGQKIKFIDKDENKKSNCKNYKNGVEKRNASVVRDTILKKR